MRLSQAMALAALLSACAAPAVGAPAPGGGVMAVEPRLSSISANVFAPRCSSTACHGGTGNAPLDLTAEAAWLALVNVPSSQAERMALVAPGDPDQSYLVLKLRGTHAAVGWGAPMPPDGSLGDEELQAIVTWIADGAADDR